MGEDKKKKERQDEKEREVKLAAGATSFSYLLTFVPSKVNYSRLPIGILPFAGLLITWRGGGMEGVEAGECVDASFWNLWNFAFNGSRGKNRRRRRRRKGGTTSRSSLLFYWTKEKETKEEREFLGRKEGKEGGDGGGKKRRAREDCRISRYPRGGRCAKDKKPS